MHPKRVPHQSINSCRRCFNIQNATFTQSAVGVIIIPLFSKAECVHTLKGLALPRASHSGKIALSGSRRLRSTLAAVPVLFAHDVVTEIEIGRIISPSVLYVCALFACMQLLEERRCGRCLAGFEEGPITFPPTYRYQQGRRLKIVDCWHYLRLKNWGYR